jgi:hypothetical protein
MEGTDGQTPLVCPGHTRGVVQVSYSNPTPDGVFLISACLDAKVPALADCGDVRVARAKPRRDSQVHAWARDSGAHAPW